MKGWIDTVRKRGISLLLILVLLLALLPQQVSAAETATEKIEKQVRSTYLTALYRSGRRSFNGYCGALVSWQTFVLGIDTVLYGCNGKDQFDQYKNMGTTTGGYRIRSYPAGRYQLRTALQEITQRGSVDVFNLLVGFQRTNTQEGSIYGHAVFIHAIIDGIVYFTECYNTSLGGKYYAEGTTISCSIDTFCLYYNAWTVFEGVIYFGHRNYSEVCQQYPASMYAIAVKDSEIYTQPFDGKNTDINNTVRERLTAGQLVKVTGLLQTPGGHYWYALDGQDAYVPADVLEYAADCHEDIALTKVKMPTAHNRGKSFSLGGTVVAPYSGLSSVQVDVYPLSDPNTPVFSVQAEAGGSSMELNGDVFEKALRFGELEPGDYGISVSVGAFGYVLKRGQPEKEEIKKNVWLSHFRVIPQWGNYVTVTFDGNGGKAPVQQAVAAKGESLILPGSTGAGAQLLGWSTDPDGLQMVEEPFVANKNTVLYAQWGGLLTRDTGWLQQDGYWQFYKNGALAEGWFTFAGMRFYQLASGIIVRGWREIDSKEFYFSETGKLLSGWQEISGSRYYLYEDGGKATGWVELEGYEYCFEEDGRLKTQWAVYGDKVYYFQRDGFRKVGRVVIDGADCSFNSAGVLQFAQLMTGYGSYYVVYDRTSTTDLDIQHKLLLG